jgi:hypothetical protein
MKKFDKETACMVAEMACEFAMGASISVIKMKVVDPHLTKGEKFVTDVGMLPISWMIGRGFGKMWLKFCDNAFGTDFEDIYESL